MSKKLPLIALALLLASSLSFCGTDEGEKTPGLDSGVEALDAASSTADSGQDVLPGADAGFEPGPDAGPTKPDASVPETACSRMNQQYGLNLTVTCDGKTLDFSEELFAYFDKGEGADRFILYSATGQQLAFDIFSSPESCPVDLPLPWSLATSTVGFSITDFNTGDDFGLATGANSEGMFKLEGFTITEPRELSFSCTNCKLVGGKDANGVRHSCTVNGTFRGVAE